VKILFVVHGYKPAYRLGGPITSVAAVAERLTARGHEVTVFTTNWNLDQFLDVPTNRAVDVDGVKVWYFTVGQTVKKYLPFVPYLAKAQGYLYSPPLRDALRAHMPGFDLVHTHLPFIYPTYAAARASRRAGKPLFYHQRGVLDAERMKFRSLKKNIYLSLIERPILRGATTLFALTEAEVASYRRVGVTTPVVVVPNGIDVGAFGAPPDPSDLEALGIGPGDAVIVFMGRLHPIKGVDRLLEAFVRIGARIPSAKLVLAGPDEFGLQKSLVATAGAAGLGRRVIFPGMVEGRQKASLLARADVFSLPSEGEGFSVAILEALASGAPVVISPGCHFDEVAPAGAGLVVGREPAAIADALVDLLAEPGRRRTMGEKGMALVRDRYSWDTVVARMEAAYAEGLERHAAAGSA
jgi:glycosyltransferase involved in cell wall biosynthesis